MKYDLVIIGNGILGTLSAINIKRQNPKAKIILIGKNIRPFSASVGAGAMANVYAEIEKGPFNDQNEARYLNIGLSARSRWLKILDDLKIKNKIITATDTVVFLKKKASSFEKENYMNMQQTSLSDKKAVILKKQKIQTIFPNTYKNISEATLLKGEFAMCTVSLFNLLDKEINNFGISKISDHVKSVKIIHQNKFQINLEENSNIIEASKVIVSAGSFSESLFEKRYNIIPMLQGVGSAIILHVNSTIPKSFSKFVIRTVNRGGAQCGLHTVPRSNQTLYLGAGNYITKPSLQSHRIETIRYLYDLFTNELVGKQAAYPLLGNISLGYRPRTIDGFPCIGPHQKYQNIFFATGTNRVGLTWAPEISYEASKWFADNKLSDTFNGWHPDRSPISFGSEEKCIEYFIESRISAGLEHENFTAKEVSKMKKKFQQIAKKQIFKIKKIYPDININPDNWQSILGL